MLPQVRKMAKAGMTEIEIADFLEITPLTLTQWCARYPKFLKALDLGKRQSTKRVSRALFHRAIGYTHESVKVFNDKGVPLIVPIREHVPPDINAAMFWLKNKDPENWQDRTGLDISGSVNIVASTLSTARQRALQARSTAPTIEATLDNDVPSDAQDVDSE